MTTASIFGSDVACMVDADALFSPTTGPLGPLPQDVYHRVTTDHILGDGGPESPTLILNWGFDCRRLLGIHTDLLPAYQAVIAQRIQQDERIQSAIVTLESVTVRGIAAVKMTVACKTSAGPAFSFVKLVTALTVADFGVSP